MTESSRLSGGGFTMGKIAAILLFLLLGPAWLPAAELPVADSLKTLSAWQTGGEVRLRTERILRVPSLPDDFHRLRLRSKLGLVWAGGNHALSLRLANEWEHSFRHGEEAFSWDELIIDHAQWAWTTPTFQLSLGRQDLIWNDGFLVLEGHPLDGSRSIYQNALRLRGQGYRRHWEMALVAQTRRDPLVLLGDQNRHLTDGAERALLLRLWCDRGSQLTSISKQTLLGTWRSRHTLAFRQSKLLGDRALLEIAAQHGEGSWSMAWQAALRGQLPRGTRVELGAYCYGAEYEAPWGRWPKWSELLIYMLINEGGVANWRDIGAVLLKVDNQVGGTRIGAEFQHLLSTGGGLDTRGQLIKLHARFPIFSLRGQLLGEAFLPAGADGQDRQFYLRWELIKTL